MDTNFSFSLSHTDGLARRGTIQTPHGTIQTPIFMPVGTRATVKALSPQDLKDAGSQIILGNTYHLSLRPGAELIKKMGGLHQFMAWDKPILTDSGGFQVFSLAQGAPRGEHQQSNIPKLLNKIDDDGVTFRSYYDGSLHRMTPESCMQIQMALGSDFIMAFDQCPPGQSDQDTVRVAMDRTTAWLKRCVQTMDRPGSRLLGIIQGGIHQNLRIEHAQAICEHDLFGFAIGGLSVGEAKEDMWKALAATTPHMPTHKPRYLMGVGTPMDLLDGIALGVDMFDCVMPTRNARNGTLFTSQGKLSIKSKCFQDDPNPIDAECNCMTCRTFSRAYMRHLYLSKELLFFRLASLHNIAFYLDLMAQARNAIERCEFASFYRKNQATQSAEA